MSTLDEIAIAKSAVLAGLDRVILNVQASKGLTTPQQEVLHAAIASLLAKRHELIVQPYEGGLDSSRMSTAVGILEKAAVNISSIAARLNTSAEIITSISELTTATDLATCALAGTHGSGEGPRG